MCPFSCVATTISPRAATTANARTDKNGAIKFQTTTRVSFCTFISLIAIDFFFCGQQFKGEPAGCRARASAGEGSVRVQVRAAWRARAARREGERIGRLRSRARCDRLAWRVLRRARSDCAPLPLERPVRLERWAPRQASVLAETGGRC